MLLFFAITIVAITDRLTKTLALVNTASAAVLPAGLLSFEPGINKLGPLGIIVPHYLFFILAAVLIVTLFVLIWSETEPTDRALFAGALLGIASNSYDKFRYGHIVDAFRLIGGLSFNLADVLIVIGIMGVVLRYRWPRQQEQNNISC